MPNTWKQSLHETQQGNAQVLKLYAMLEIVSLIYLFVSRFGFLEGKFFDVVDRKPIFKGATVSNGLSAALALRQ